MKKASLLLFLLVLIVSCGTKEYDLTVTGSIKGLKKGTLYLQKLQDTTLVVMDSIILSGESPYLLQSDLEEPEMLYLTLDKNAAEVSRIGFFANKGTTEINTTVKRFVFDAKIIGSEQQKKWAEFQGVISKFNDQNLDGIKAKFEAQRSGDSTAIAMANEATEKLLKRKYLYAINFAINNKSSEVAPYVALSEIYDANVQYLDTIYKALPEDISKSKYGKQLDTFIKDIKVAEAKN